MLVTIIVVSYNSEKTILATLKSISKQSYRNFEVIICDDNSSDNTLKIVKNWQEEIKKRVTILASSINQGTVKNINKGLRIAKGKWIKIIAADDILFEDCIKKNIEFILRNPQVNICFSKVQFFGYRECIREVYPNLKEEEYMQLSAKEQYKILKTKNFVPAPSSFIKKEIFQRFGLFDEDIKLIEDYPYWLRLTSLDEKLYYFPQKTVFYRKRKRDKSKLLDISEIMLDSYSKLYIKYLIKRTGIILKWHYILELYIYIVAIKFLKNKNNFYSRLLLRILKVLDIYRGISVVENLLKIGKDKKIIKK